MEKFYLGSTIRHLRKKKKMTLDELAEGICSKRQLQRIETNTTIPSANMLTLISKKLNEDVSAYFPYSEYENPIEIHDLILKLEEALTFRNHDVLYQLSLPYFEVIDTLPIQLQQLIAYYHGAAITSSLKYETPDPQIYEYFLSLTVNFKNHQELCLGFKSLIEYRLISGLINLTYFLNIFPTNAHEHTSRLNEGINLLLLLIESYKSNYLTLDTDFLGRLYNNLAHSYFLLREYDSAIEYINIALEPRFCPKNHSVIGMLYYIKGNIFVYQENLEQAKKCYQYFIMLFEIQGESEAMLPIIKYLKETYNI